jgi:hypothetical protein
MIKTIPSPSLIIPEFPTATPLVAVLIFASLLLTVTKKNVENTTYPNVSYSKELNLKAIQIVQSC